LRPIAVLALGLHRGSSVRTNSQSRASFIATNLSLRFDAYFECTSSLQSRLPVDDGRYLTRPGLIFLVRLQQV